MEKFKSIHIAELAEWHKHNVPQDIIPCLKYKGELYPLSRMGENEAFIYGVGWRKVNKAGTNRIDVPVYDGLLSHFKEYVEKYGKRIMFYSLTGYDLSSQDCVAYRAQMEFCVILQPKIYNDFGKYQQFVEDYHRLRELMRDKTIEIFKTLGLTNEDTISHLNNISDFESHGRNEYIPKATFSFMGIPLEPSLDVTEQEKRNLLFLNACARLKYRQGIDPKDEDAWYSNVWRDSEAYKQEVDKHIDNDSIRNQMFYLYGNEIGELYEKLMSMFDEDKS